MQDYRGLRVWAEATRLAVDVRRAVQQFPRTGYGAIQSQLIRAAESVVLNIVEGCGAQGQRELARFLEVSIKSASEVQGALELARDYGVLKPLTWRALDSQAATCRRMLTGLRRKVLESADGQRATDSRKTPDGNSPSQDSEPSSASAGVE